MKIKKAKLCKKPNSKLIPVSELNFTDDNIKFFNKLVKQCYSKKYNKIVRTVGGNISVKTLPPAFDIRNTKSLIELTVIDCSGLYRLQLRNVKSEDIDNVLPGWKAFKEFYKLCLDFNIDLKDYIIENGAEVKTEIEKYIIKMGNEFFKDKIHKNAHHIDFHSAFPSGLIETHPEFTGVITKLYNERKTNEIYKLILNATIGYMQSEPCCKARWAHLSRDAINRNNTKIRELAKRLEKSGRVILGYNTDGIWYVGDIYHGKGEGSGLTEWSNDHTNCTIRFKSAGAYEFIENGVYTPVLRGHTKLDDIKPRSKWQWGDIYQDLASVEKYGIDDLGYVHKKEVIYG